MHQLNVVYNPGAWERTAASRPYNIYFQTSPATIMRALHDLIPLATTLGHISWDFCLRPCLSSCQWQDMNTKRLLNTK